MTTKQPAAPAPTEAATPEVLTMDDAVREYVRTYALWHGRPWLPDTSACPATRCGGAWNGDIWAVPYPKR